MQKLASFTFAHPDYFESLARYPIEDDYRDLLRDILPADGWELSRDDIWLMAHPSQHELPTQGFKIHLSATPTNATELIRRAIPACVEESAAFKVVADPRLLSIVQSKTYGRGSSSKFITVYPADLEAFHRLVETLDERTEGLESAYVLSDRRYGESRVVFYRYGGFLPRYEVNATGTRRPLIETPDGTLVADDRHPYYRLPDWVDDPFGADSVEDRDDHLLAGRYEIEEALAFSNAGGVYKATDRETGDDVVIKEARPQVAAWVHQGEGDDEPFVLDAVGILHKEHRLLERLADLPFVPRAIDLFQEWEHHFRVEELVDGVPLTSFRAREDFALIPFDGERERTERFSRGFRTIARQLVDQLTALHRRGVLVGDLSPSNVLVDPDDLTVRLIDFESAFDHDDEENLSSFSGAWSTPGFRAPGRLARGGLEAGDDVYALGMTLYSLLIPVVALFELAPEAKAAFLDKLERAVGLPREVRETIFALLDGDLGTARRVLADWRIEASVDAGRERMTGTDHEAVAAELPRVADRVTGRLLTSWDAERDDRLWPTDYQVFLTNPLSIAYGAAGPLLHLLERDVEPPAECTDWFAAKAADREVRGVCPPGLYLGLSGVAYTLARLGRADAAADAWSAVADSPMLGAGDDVESSLFYGTAGCGLAALLLDRHDPERGYLRDAVTAGERLLARGEEKKGDDEIGLAWPSAVDEQQHYGLAYGSSGVALFLLELSAATGERRFLDAARRAMAYDLSAAREIEGELKWGRWEGDELVEPYWLHGAAGIGSALVRFAERLGEERYLRLARRVGASAFSKFTVVPAQVEGLSGIGELMVDLHRVDGDDAWRRRGLEIADSVLRFRVDRDDGTAFPGRFLLRLSDGYAYGSAGVGLFLDRLANPRRRLLHDLDAPRAVAVETTEAEAA